MDYIADYFRDFENALFSGNGKNSLGKRYTDYIDLDSFAKNYVVQELMLNLDAGQSSFFMYKDAGDGKLVASPVWDFDYTLGRHSRGQDVGMNVEDPSVLYANRLSTVIAQLFRRHEDFRLAANSQWDIASSSLPEVAAGTRALARTLEPSAVMNAVRWNVFGTTDKNDAASSYRAAADKAVDFFTRRAAALSPAFTPEGAFLYYEANGGSGRRLEEHVHLRGDAVAVKTSGDEWTSVQAPDGAMVFDCWNTKADGNGTSYRPGEKITLNDTVTTLYAQWREKTPEEIEREQQQSKSFWDRIKDFFSRIIDFFRNLFKR